MGMARDYVGKYVFPVHRLDRATSGVLVFALNTDIAREISQQFEHRLVSKVYHAVVRGWPPEETHHDVQLKDDRGVLEQAVSDFKRMETYEFEIANEKFATTRLALVEARPKTGRRHQLRRQLRRLNHPILGDTTHGDHWYNTLGRNLGAPRLMLHASEIQFTVNQKNISVQSPLPQEFQLFKNLVNINGSPANTSNSPSAETAVASRAL
jgi:tRNA pseudouridine65 synthase